MWKPSYLVNMMKLNVLPVKCVFSLSHSRYGGSFVTRYVERWYRGYTKAPDLVPFSVQIKRERPFNLGRENLQGPGL